MERTKLASPSSSRWGLSAIGVFIRRFLQEQMARRRSSIIAATCLQSLLLRVNRASSIIFWTTLLITSTLILILLSVVDSHSSELRAKYYGFSHAFPTRKHTLVMRNNWRRCDEICAIFKRLWVTWPTRKPRAALYVLVTSKSSPDVHVIETILRKLYKNFLQRYPYPVIVFHDTASRENVKLLIRKLSSIIRAFPQEIVDLQKRPEFLSGPFLSRLQNNIFEANRHRFHAKTVHELPIVQDLEYLWQVDEGCVIERPLDTDLFLTMRKRGLNYVFVKGKRESESSSLGLFEAIRVYAKLKGIIPIKSGRNFTLHQFRHEMKIFETSSFKMADFREYISYLDQLGGIYYSGWTDSAIKAFSVYSFMPLTKILRLRELCQPINSIETLLSAEVVVREN